MHGASSAQLILLETLVSFCLAGFLILLLVLTVKGCVKDARRRGKSPLLVIIAVIFFFPFGLIAWILFRPEPLNSRRGRFDLENYRAH